MSQVIDVTALWDAEAGVWVAESTQVPGLITEAPTREALMEKLQVLIPELLDANGYGAGSVYCARRYRVMSDSTTIKAKFREVINL
jgi:hypothetical protein